VIQAGLFWLALLVAVPVFWRLPSRWRALFFALVSMAVLATIAPIQVIAVLAWTVVIQQVMRRPGLARPMSWVLAAGLIGQLILFKYLPPLVAPLWPESPFTRLAVPLGLSFYTFMMLHYIVEQRRGKLGPHALESVLCWVFALPKFTAGPIERFDHYQRERRRDFRWDLVAEGGTRIVHGLIKKLVISDLLLTWCMGQLGGTPAQQLASLDSTPVVELWLWSAASMARLYMDFGGYSDIAIGGCLLFGYRITENFRFPFLARNLSDFWHRWHISLADWCRAYVYMPLLGMTRNPFIAVFATFGVMGLWHAASLPWLAWGALHAAGLSLALLWRREQRRRGWRWTEARWTRPLAVALTVTFVCGAHALTTVHGVGDGADLLRLMGRLVGL
jgi:alginate O-acetyltransferase complex protein AlgI